MGKHSSYWTKCNSRGLIAILSKRERRSLARAIISAVLLQRREEAWVAASTASPLVAVDSDRHMVLAKQWIVVRPRHQFSHSPEGMLVRPDAGRQPEARGGIAAFNLLSADAWR